MHFQMSCVLVLNHLVKATYCFHLIPKYIFFNLKIKMAGPNFWEPVLYVDINYQQEWRKIKTIGGASSNVVGIICPLWLEWC